MNLYEYIKVNDFKGCTLKIIRSFTSQILPCLLLLKRQRVIHCDLKPENILLVNMWESRIKIIDFGSSCFEDQKGTEYNSETSKQLTSSLYVHTVQILPVT